MNIKYTFYQPDKVKRNSIIFYGKTFQNKDIANRLGIKEFIEFDRSKINIFFIFRYFFSIKSYFILFRYGFITFCLYNFLQYYKPYLLLTFIDNDLRFYLLKKYFSKIYFVSIQNGIRGAYFDFFGLPNLKKISELKNFSCDYLFVFNNYVKLEYQKYIDAKIITCGSYKNNKVLDKKYIKNGIAFISQ